MLNIMRSALEAQALEKREQKLAALDTAVHGNGHINGGMIIDARSIDDQTADRPN